MQIQDPGQSKHVLFYGNYQLFQCVQKLRATMKNHMQHGVKWYLRHKAEMLNSPVIAQSFHGESKPHKYAYIILKIYKNFHLKRVMCPPIEHIHNALYSLHNSSILFNFVISTSGEDLNKDL
jgi:hypothetical protein